MCIWRWIGFEDLFGEGVEGGVIVGQWFYGLIKVGEECLEVDDCWIVVDLIGCVFYFDLLGMVG